mgnify:CR=1
MNDGETKIGVIVDAVLGQQNVLLKYSFPNKPPMKT